MDDANVPSLLSLPYLDWCPAGDATYQRTRALVLSAGNPYFHRGGAGEGIGSPHYLKLQLEFIRRTMGVKKD